MKRVNLFLGALLAVLLLLDLLTLPRVATRASGGPLFPAFEPGAAAAIELARQSGDGANDPPLRIERGEGGWRLPSAEGFRADTWLVDELLGSLGRLSRTDLVSEDPERPAEFGLAPGVEGEPAEGLDVRVLDVSGAVLAAYRQGQALERMGALEGIYLRPAGQTGVYRAPFVPRVSLSPEAWLDTRVARFDAGAVRALRLVFAGRRTASFDRAPDGQWTSSSGDAPQVALDSLLSAAGGLYHSGLEAAEPREEHGLEPPLLAVELTLEDPEGERSSRRLSIGAERGEVTFATFDGWERPWVVGVRTGLLEDLLEATEAVLERAELEDHSGEGR